MLISLIWKGGRCSFGAALILACVTMYVCVVYYVINLDHPAVNQKLSLLQDFYYVKFLIFLASGIVLFLFAAIGWDCLKMAFRETTQPNYF